MKLEAFEDELRKIAEDQMAGVLIGSAAGQATNALLDMPIKGKSLIQRHLEHVEKKPYIQKSEVRKKRVAKAKEKAKVKAEMSYGSLLSAPAGYAGYRVAGKLGKGIRPTKLPSEAVGREIAKKLSKELKTDIRVVNVKGLGQAMMVPEGGSLPKLLRKLEMAMYEKKKMPLADIKRAIKGGGAIFAPVKSPEIVAHELGHASLRKSPSSRKLWMAGRAGAPLAGSIAAAMMLSSKDSQDWKVKAAPAAAALGLAPLFLDEGLASKRGYKAVKKVLPKLTPANLKLMRGNLLRAFGTYGALMAGATVAPVAAMSVSRTLAGKKKKS